MAAGEPPTAAGGPAATFGGSVHALNITQSVTPCANKMKAALAVNVCNRSLIIDE